MKPFAWSYSKYKNFDACPKRHYEVDLAHNFNDSSEQLDWGNSVHDALKAACTGAYLPDGMKDYQKWVLKYAAPNLPGTLYVEQKYAITKDFQPCAWFDGRAWFRGICDLLRIDGPVALAVDWKTGKMLHDSRQLMLMSQCIFAHYPQVKRVKTEFVWLKEDACTPEVFNRATIMREWPPVLEQVKRMEEAARTLTYEPKPNRLCGRYCPVVSCPFHGKSHR
jgi:hypothetical protein